MKKSISEAELDVMRVLWASENPMTVQEICNELSAHDWAYKTVATLLTRMEKKGAVSSKKVGRAYSYTPILNKDDYVAEQTSNLISALYNGSAKDLAVSLFKNNSLTQTDIDELKEMFDL